ncbi:MULTISPECIES: metal-dependent hydrolase [Mycobacterium]|nr:MULTISPECIES: metal-dependent hydrolase [Mycobacterium]BDB40182.1 metal-dependent hydrolase [Mycobacterium kiyosense]GLB97661.1 metal-dependent hydrolase [Mycobacterium kiyosense]GLD20662.1 metal-dependent hydrolase [Mycobacterium kiyosense]
MSTLKIRKPPFSFDAQSAPYLWQPNNPDFSEMCNAISFAAPAFERYIVQVVQLAAPRLAGTPMQQEAEDFLRQEAQHARMHRKHAATLVARYPKLAETQKKIDQAYTELLENESLDFNLAYVTDIEATFTPLFGMMLNNEHTLFRGGADRVASLFLWHFMEEIEHRSSAFGIYDTAVGRRWYRVRALPKVMRHVTALMNTIMDDFVQHVPEADRGAVSGAALSFGSAAFRDIPRRQMAAMLYRLALSQAPFHRPDRQPIPRFTALWYDAEDQGRDITRWYAAPAAPNS